MRKVSKLIFPKFIFILSVFLFSGLLLGSSKTVLAQGAQSQEEIDSYNVFIDLNKDATINIREVIEYNFGTNQKHGIYRDIIYKYKARGGNYKLRISDISVVDKNGNEYNFTTLYSGNDFRIKIGDADKYVTGEKTYIIDYKVKRAINYFSDYDELYWNAIGTKWDVPINKAFAEITFPEKMKEEDLKKECFVGAFGSNVNCSTSQFIEDKEDGLVKKVEFHQESLDANEGLTTVVGIPKGIVYQPTKLEIFIETLKDNWVLFIPVIVFIIMFTLWYKRGRDPKGRGTIIAQFDAPDNLTPAEVGTIADESVHNKDVSANIINLAVKGYLKITRLEKKGIFKSKDYQLDKLKEVGEELSEFDKKLMEGLFSSDKETIELSDLKNKFYQDLADVRKKIYKSVVSKGYFSANPNVIRAVYIVIGVVVAVFGFFFGIISQSVFGLLSLFVSGFIILIFGFFMPAKTKRGVEVKEHILGLKEYLRVAEKERLKFHNAPEKNPKHFEELLPYAMALGVEKQWAKQFEGIYNQKPSWYDDPTSTSFTAPILVSNLGSFSTQTNNTLASSPSSAAGGSSGFSGGGAGGGFGGGGGGSW